MCVYWKIFFGKTGFWLATEIWLNLIGLDNLADYSEFIFASELLPFPDSEENAQISVVPPKFCIKIDEYCPLDATANVQNNRQQELDRALLEENKQKCKKLKNPCIRIWCCQTSLVAFKSWSYDNDD